MKTDIEQFFWRLSLNKAAKELWLKFVRERKIVYDEVTFHLLGEFDVPAMVNCFEHIFGIPGYYRSERRPIEQYTFLSLDSSRETFIEDLNTLERLHERREKGSSVRIQHEAHRATADLRRFARSRRGQGREDRGAGE